MEGHREHPPIRFGAADAPPGPTCAAEIVFGLQGNADEHLLEGWSSPEQGFTWSTGPTSTLAFPLPDGPGQDADLFIELRLSPFLVPRKVFSQRLRILLNGIEIANEIVRADSMLAFRVPRTVLDVREPNRPQYLRLFQPDYGRPCDYDICEDSRELGFMLRTLRLLRCPPKPRADITALPPLQRPPDREALNAQVRQAVGHTLEDLGAHFESLGHNCEFGLVQRHFGAEPLGLLRFAGIALADLFDGLRERFDHLGKSLDVTAIGGGAEYIVEDRRYHVGFHTFTSAAGATADEIRTTYVRHLAVLRRLFLERLATGERIWVVHLPGEFSRAQARALHLRLRSFGPNSLLYVDQGPGLPSGGVEQLDHGLYHGKLDSFAPPGEAGKSDVPGWASLCVNAYRLWRGKQG